MLIGHWIGLKGCDLCGESIDRSLIYCKNILEIQLNNLFQIDQLQALCNCLKQKLTVYPKCTKLERDYSELCLETSYFFFYSYNKRRNIYKPINI